MINLLGQLKELGEKITIGLNPKVNKEKDFFYFHIMDVFHDNEILMIELENKLEKDYGIKCNIANSENYSFPFKVDDFIDIDNIEDTLKNRIDMYYSSISLNPKIENFKQIKNKYKKEFNKNLVLYKKNKNQELKIELIRLNIIILLLEEYEDNFKLAIDSTIGGCIAKIKCRKIEKHDQEYEQDLFYPELKKNKNTDNNKGKLLHFPLDKDNK